MPELETTEKITMNLGLVDLGQIDLLVTVDQGDALLVALSVTQKEGRLFDDS